MNSRDFDKAKYEWGMFENEKDRIKLALNEFVPIGSKVLCQKGNSKSFIAEVNEWCFVRPGYFRCTNMKTLKIRNLYFDDIIGVVE